MEHQYVEGQARFLESKRRMGRMQKFWANVRAVKRLRVDGAREVCGC